MKSYIHIYLWLLIGLILGKFVLSNIFFYNLDYKSGDVYTFYNGVNPYKINVTDTIIIDDSDGAFVLYHIKGIEGAKFSETKKYMYHNATKL